MAVSHAHIRVDPDPQFARQRIVGVDKTAFGPFDMFDRYRVWNTAEAQAVGRIVEWRGRHGH